MRSAAILQRLVLFAKGFSELQNLEARLYGALKPKKKEKVEIRSFK